ncbi:MAG: TolC family protein [Thermodesulfobacteriota bacterium]
MKKPASILALLLLLLPASATAVTLAELRQAAVANRALVKKQEAELDKTAEDIREAKSGYYPSLDLSYTINRLDQAALLEDRENSVARAAVTWNLFAGFRDKYGLLSADAGRQAEEFRLQGIGQDIRLDVALGYLAIHADAAAVKVAEDEYANLERAFHDAEQRFRVGLIDRNGLLRFRVDLDNAGISRARAHSRLRQDIELLRQAAANAALEAADLEFDEFASLPALEDIGVYEQRLRDRRSELKTFDALIAAASSQEAVARADVYPRLDAVGSYRVYDDALISGAGDVHEDETRGQLVLSWNLFDGYGKQARRQRAALTAVSLRHDRAETETRLLAALRNLHSQCEVGLENVRAAATGIEQAEENLRTGRLKYEQGLQTETDLLTAIAALSRARSNHVLATTEVFDSWFRIERAVEGFE